MSQELTEFCSDSQLVELVELAKSSNDFLDLLTPRENQHSDVLAWCFNAKEGHGQGDAILKDFLLAVFHAATENEAGDRIYGRGLSRDFVRTWTPARILTSSFATAISFREYSLPRAKSGTDIAERRLDLLVIDPDNQLLIVIENKAGARFRSGQLQGYLEGVQTELLARSAFKDFLVLFVALERNFDSDLDPLDDDNFDSRWVRLNYDWLRPASKRAELAVERGNQSAAVLLSYCRRQTGWESEEMQEMTRLARELAISFPTVIRDLKRIAKELVQPETWTPQLLRSDSAEGLLLKLYLQNQNAIDWLICLSPLQLLHARLAEDAPELNEVDEVYEYGRIWMNYQMPTDGRMPKVDSHWPLYVSVKYLNPESEGWPQFRTRLVWRPHYVPDAERERLVNVLSKYYPAAKNSVCRKKALWLADHSHLSFESAETAVKEILEKIDRAFGSAT